MRTSRGETVRRWENNRDKSPCYGWHSERLLNALRSVLPYSIDTGDYVIVVNADKVTVTGKKLDQKIYYNHSDYVGGMKETTLRELQAKKPEKVIELAVK